MFRRVAPTIATVVAVGGAALFVFLQLRPDLLFADTTPAGGDMGAHVWGPAFVRDHLLPNGRLTGWAPDWYAGFPFPNFYFPVPTLLIVLVDVVMPYNIAFKLVSVLGLVSLPVAAWAFGRLAKVPGPGPACLAVATVPFLFDRGFTIYGGNIPSTLAGEFSFSISLSLALVFLGLAAKMLETGRYKAITGVVLVLTLLSHVIPTFFAITAAVVMALLRPSRRRITSTVTVGVLAGLLGAFWTLPFLLRLPYTNDMGWEKVVLYRENLFPHDGRWLLVLAAVGAITSLWRKSNLGTLITVMTVIAALGFRFAPQGKIWNARLLPFWFLCLYLLAGLAVAWLFRAIAWVTAPGRPREGVLRWGALATPPLVLAATLVFVALPLQALPSWSPLSTEDRSFIPSWTEWNYSGYEAKASYPEYDEVVDTMAEVGREEGCGRAMWEYEEELNQLGTPLALMLLPYWTNGCIGSMEGLYYESSATTPYHFLAASEVSKRPSRPQRNLPYRDLDLTTGVPHMQLLGVRYYMAFSADARAAAAQHPDLELVASTGAFPVNYPEGVRDRSWEIYEVADSALVEPLAFEPVVAKGLAGSEKGWLDASVDWWQDQSRFAVPLAEDGPGDWRRVGRSALEGSGPTGRRVRPAEVTNIRSDDDSIRFSVDRAGSPVLVKTSFFPNWKASGAEGPWRVTPNLMVVVPTGRNVELSYGYSGADISGYGLTGLGLVATVLLWRRGRRQKALEPDQPPPPSDAVAAGVEEPTDEQLTLDLVPTGDPVRYRARRPSPVQEP